MNAGETFERLQSCLRKDARRTRSGNRCQRIELVVASGHLNLYRTEDLCAERCRTVFGKRPSVRRAKGRVKSLKL